MASYLLPETELMKLSAITEDDRSGTYVIEPLSPGYGVTLGNSIRRVLLSSLAGSAISAVRIEGVTHEFATLAGMTEDVVELILNLKALRVRLLTDEPTTIQLEARGPGEVYARNFTANANVQFVDPDHYLATLDKQGKLSLEVLIEHGRGYVPTEQKRHEQHPLGTISIDSIFTPVKKVHYEVENTRVGGMTNFDKVTLDITTDGTIHPRQALGQAAQILVDHFSVVGTIGETVPETKVKAAKKSKKTGEESEAVAGEAAVTKDSRKESPKATTKKPTVKKTKGK